MLLPNADRAEIDPAKLRDYLLSFTHPVGRFKARFFNALGYIAAEWQTLEDFTELLDEKDLEFEADSLELAEQRVLEALSRQANAAAWAFWEAQPPHYRKGAAHWVMSAKREETRQKRLATLIADSAAGRWIGLYRQQPGVK